MMKKLITIIFQLLFFAIVANAQYKLSGRVTDSITGESLAFVNIVYNKANQGTTTDLDGYFIIDSKEPVKLLCISYLGYKKDSIYLAKNTEYLHIKLAPDITKLGEVTIYPGVNPAHRIINLVIQNKNNNHPESLNSFSYTSYNKFHATFDLADIPIIDTTSLSADSIKIINEAADSVSDSTVNRLNRAKRLLDKQHLLLMESVSERKFKKPDKNKETVIANRISGLQNPMFFMLATQMQSFSFYDETINLYDKKYLNPISKGSTERYFFMIEDTMFTEQFDTVFVISFRPRKGKNFDGLKGTLQINSNKYAVQNVLASPAEPNSTFTIQIQQMYEYVQNTQWFPVQLNTNFTFNSLSVDIDGYMAPLKGIGKSYIQDIRINPDLDAEKFDHIVVDTEKDAHKKDDEFWNKYRRDSLNIQEENTYQVIDSLGKEANLDNKLAFLEAFASGNIPVSIFNIELDKIMWYNKHEGYRLGLGISTNENLLQWASIGGYFAYGFGDKQFKYGGNLLFDISKKHELILGVSYKNDVTESDNYTFKWSNQLLSTEVYRYLLLTQFDHIEKWEIFAGARLFRYFKAEAGFSHNQKNILNTNRYLMGEMPPVAELEYYKAEISGKYAFKEKFIQTPKGNKLSMGTNWPILWFNIAYGFDNTGFDNGFLKFEAQIDKRFSIKMLGNTYLRIAGGFADTNTPYSMLYSGYGSYSWIDAGNTFNTMRINEFMNDCFTHVFIKHDFGSLLFKTKKWQPEIALITNVGWSDWSKKDIVGQNIGPYNNFYFESGVQFNYILRASIIGYGFATYYRYGAYHLPNLIDNFAFKLTLTYSL
jgi:hypothetical protein